MHYLGRDRPRGPVIERRTLGSLTHQPFCALVCLAVFLMIGGRAAAESDILIATITAGRLYVIGNTERPRTPVLLEGQFRTESDERGKFQFEAIFHPARCVISVAVEDRTYEAVVANCAQQGHPGAGSVLGTQPVQIAQAGQRGPPGPPAHPCPAGLPGVPEPVDPPGSSSGSDSLAVAWRASVAKVENERAMPEQSVNATSLAPRIGSIIRHPPQPPRRPLPADLTRTSVVR